MTLNAIFLVISLFKSIFTMTILPFTYVLKIIGDVVDHLLGKILEFWHLHVDLIEKKSRKLIFSSEPHFIGDKYYFECESSFIVYHEY